MCAACEQACVCYSSQKSVSLPPPPVNSAALKHQQVNSCNLTQQHAATPRHTCGEVEEREGGGRVKGEEGRGEERDQVELGGRRARPGAFGRETSEMRKEEERDQKEG